MIGIFYPCEDLSLLSKFSTWKHDPSSQVPEPWDVFQYRLQGFLLACGPSSGCSHCETSLEFSQIQIQLSSRNKLLHDFWDILFSGSVLEPQVSSESSLQWMGSSNLFHLQIRSTCCRNELLHSFLDIFFRNAGTSMNPPGTDVW